MEWSDPSPARRNGKRPRSSLRHSVWVGQSMCHRKHSHLSRCSLRLLDSSSVHLSSLSRMLRPSGPHSSRQMCNKTVMEEEEGASWSCSHWCQFHMRSTSARRIRRHMRTGTSYFRCCLCKNQGIHSLKWSVLRETKGNNTR